MLFYTICVVVKLLLVCSHGIVFACTYFCSWRTVCRCDTSSV